MARVAVMTGREFVSKDGRMRLPLEGCSVNRCCVDWAVALEMQSPDGTGFVLRIGDIFTFTAIDGVETLLRPEEDPTGLGPVLACTHDSGEGNRSRGRESRAIIR